MPVVASFTPSTSGEGDKELDGDMGMSGYDAWKTATPYEDEVELCEDCGEEPRHCECEEHYDDDAADAAHERAELLEDADALASAGFGTDEDYGADVESL